MRVLMFGWEFPPHISGGLGTACLGITHGLTEKNIEVLFVVPKVYGDESIANATLIGAEGIPHRLHQVPRSVDQLLRISVSANIAAYPHAIRDERVESRLEKGGPPPAASSRRFHFAGGYGPNLMWEISHYASICGRIARTNEFDIIHAHDWPTFPAGIAAKKMSGRPLVVHVHATEFDRSGGNNINTKVYDIEKAGIDEADRIICVSNFTKRTLIDHYGADGRKIDVVHNGVLPVKVISDDEDVAAPSSDEKIVTFMGRITYQKGPAFFVEAAKRVLDVAPNVRFVMAGDGDMLPAMVDLVAKYGIGDRFSFTGFLKGKEVERLFARTDVFVMTSVSEPFGIVPLEAMQHKVPVVLSKQSGVAEVLDYALKVDYWDIDSLADAIYGLVAYPVLNSFLSAKGHHESMELSWADAVEKIEQCYLKALSKVA